MAQTYSLPHAHRLTTLSAPKAIAFETLFKSAIAAFLRNGLVVIREHRALPSENTGMCYAIVARSPIDTAVQTIRAKLNRQLQTLRKTPLNAFILQPEIFL